MVKNRKIIPYLAILIGPFVLFLPPLIKGEVIYWGVPSLQFIPWRFYAWECIRSGIMPWWNSLNGMGAPLLANYQLALFYPPGFILFIFAAVGGVPWIAWGFTLLVLFHVLCTGLGMVHLMKTLGYGLLAQSISGVSFSLCGYLIARAGFFSIVWVCAWLPWILVATYRLIQLMPAEGNKFIQKSEFMLCTYLVFMLLAGHAQVSWYILVLTGTWVIYWVWKFRGKSNQIMVLTKFTTVCLIALLISSVQLIPTFEYLLQSYRASSVDFEQAVSYSFWPWRFVTLVAPDFFGNPGSGNHWGYASYWEDAIYVGTIPFLLALSTLLNLFKKNTEQQNDSSLIRYLWVLIVVSFVFALGKFIPIFSFFYKYVPTFDMFNSPSRFLIWSEFGLTALAGIAAENWIPQIGRRLYWLRLSTAGAFSIILGAFLALAVGGGSVEVTSIRATALAGIWLMIAGFLAIFVPFENIDRKRIIWEISVILLIVTDLILTDINLIPFINMNAFSEISKMTVDLKESLNGHRVYLNEKDEYSLKFNRFLRFNDFRPIEPPEDLINSLLPNMTLLWNLPSANNFDPLLPDRFHGWMTMLDELPSDKINGALSFMDVGAIEKIDFDKPEGIAFENKPASGKFIFYTCSLNSFSGDNSLEILENQLNNSSPNKNDAIILEGIDPADEIKNCHESNVTITSQTEKPDEFAVSLETDQKGWLFISETWFPGWSAIVDKNKVDVLRANYLFMAIQIPAGTHMVNLKYQPTSFYIGAVLTIMGIVLLIIIWIKIK